jgi:ketosteroid isomerase-like protein
MPTSNLEVVDHLYELFDRREFAAAAEYASDEMEWHPYLAHLRAEPFRGPDGVLEFMSELFANFEDFRIERQRFIEVADSVIVFCSSTARGRVSGVELNIDTIHVWDLRDGKVARLSAYLHTEEVVEAVGARYGDSVRERLQSELVSG